MADKTKTLNDIVAECDGPVHISLGRELAIDFSNKQQADATMVSTIRLEQDGATARSKRIALCPPIIVESHAAGLRMLADLFEEVDKRG